MKSTSRRRFGTIALLSLLALFVLTVVAQSAGAALVVQHSSGSMALGLQASDPSALTLGGGTTNGGQSANVPAPKAGVPAEPAATGSTTAWVAVVVVVIAAVVVLSIWATRRRRTLSAQASLSAFCVSNPDDALCRAG